jgi:ABC-2 type transport system permease protein
MKNKPRKYALLGKLCATQAFDGGVLYILSGYGLRLIRLVIFLLVWRSLLSEGADTGGLSLTHVLTYSLISSVFSEQLNIVSSASTSFWEGSIVNRYTRPLPVMPQIMAETAGRWIPSLLLYSLPMLALSPLLGVHPLPSSVGYGLLFIVSMALAIALGFSIDFLFVALAVRLKDASWMAYVIRGAIADLFSGLLIPFALLPWGIGAVLQLLPFGSVAGAPLSIYIGAENPWQMLALQTFWNAVLWPLALLAFRKSSESMVSYGG